MKKINADWHQNFVLHCPVKNCKGMLLSSIYFHEMKCSKCEKYFVELTELKEVDKPQDEKPKEIQSQKELIHNTNWDIVLLLDACRYDYFEKYIYDFVDSGELIKVDSNSTCTGNWLSYTWTGYYPDITYISANPFINSLGVNHGGFDATKHFGKVIDVWNYGFDKKTGRVEASVVNDTAYGIIDTGGRYIVHYQQPHTPYLFLDKKKASNKFRNILNRLIPYKLQWKLVERFPSLNKKLRRKNSYQGIYRDYDDKILKEAYERNLLSVLREVRNIVELYPDRNIIVTADHGELLGEEGRYGHGGKSHPILATVPFYIVSQRELSKSDDDIVRERLKNLGYMV